MIKLRSFLVISIILLSISSIGYTTESVFYSTKHKEYGSLKSCKNCHSEKYLKHHSVRSNDCTTCHITREEPYSEVKRIIKYCSYCGVEYYNCEICGGDHHKCRHKIKTVDKDFHGEKPKEVVKVKEVIKEKIVHEETDKALADCRIHFDTDKTNIKPEFEPVLQKIADYLHKNPECKLRVIGHTDDVWTFDYNIGLSKRRANSVIHALVNKYDINPERLIPHGVGKTDPVASNQTEEGRAKNRRVQVEVMK
ncbi:MAG: OmpA family protein [bacterium]|nr:OmpA family protein [bacterium]